MRSASRTFVRSIRIYTLQVLAKIFGKDQRNVESRQLVIAPHPDDETFGLGGMIAEAASIARRQGREPQTHIVFLTSGGASHHNCCTISGAELEQKREGSAKLSTSLLGVPNCNLHFLRLQDGELPHAGHDGFDSTVRRLIPLISQICPDEIFVPHPFEGWSDHVAAEQLVQSAITSLPEILRSSGTRHTEKPKLFHYCVWFWFSMPLSRAWRVRWQNSVTIGLKNHTKNRDFTRPDNSPHQLKLAAMKVYLDDICPCGKPSCGVLPKELLSALKWDRELFFRVGR